MNGKIHLLVVASSFFALSPATAQDSDYNHNVTLEDFTVTAFRPMHEIGKQKSVIDSLALKENIALSLADVLTFNSSLFVKNHGRASLSTVSFRGTSPSHTFVSWNDMPVNSPMLGMTDFSIIPSFFIDKAALSHGASSVDESGGGLGGAISLASAPQFNKGFNLSFIQGVGSFKTFDEFFKVAYSSSKWSFSTRAVFSSSANDYTFVNHDKKLNIYDDDHNIVGQYFPKEKNRLGAFRDFHILQEAYYNSHNGDEASLNVWYTASNRDIPMISTDYSDEHRIDNSQRENTLRTVAGWSRIRSTWNIDVKAGFIHSWLGYDYRRETAQDLWNVLTRSRNIVNTTFGKTSAEFMPSQRWLISANLSLQHNDVSSYDRKLAAGSGSAIDVGYHERLLNTSASFTARWQPVDGVGLAATIREETFGRHFSPVIPALFADWRILNHYHGVNYFSLALKSSATRNYRHPSLNDLYFMPGGNPDLNSERGLSYDCGLDFSASLSNSFSSSFSANWFDSYIDDWIIWLPSFKGIFSPRNFKSVHAYGIELKGEGSVLLWHNLALKINASYSWTPSINTGKRISDADKSIGKQLPYIPLHSVSASLHAAWKGWGLLYKWHLYSERFTMTSNASSLSGRLPAYNISNLSLEKAVKLNRVGINLKIAVNNLMNADYLSVLSHPMPGRNYEAFFEIKY